MFKKPDLTMTLNGALAGLVSITAGAATPSLGAALLIGAVGGVLVVLAVPFFDKLKIDSSQALELLTRLENHFNVELPDYEMQGVSDFQTLAERIQARL